MKKLTGSVLALTLLAVMCSGCAGADGNSGDGGGSDSYALKIGNTVSKTDPFNVAYGEMETSLEEASGGKFAVDVFDSGSVGETDADVLDKVRANTLQMGNTTPNCLADLSDISAYYVYGIPYLMSTDEELNTVGESDWIKGLNEEFAKATGVKIFDGGGVNMGWFGFSATSKDIKQMSDLKGMAIRINQTNQMIALTSGAGINPQFIAFSEVYTALAQGTVDGMVTNMPLFYSNGFYDQIQSILSTHCGESYHFYIVNEQFYNSLPEDMQTMLDEHVDTLITRTRELEETYLDEATAKMEEAGVTISAASEEDEEMLKQISIDSIWWNPENSLTDNENVNKVLEILGRTDEMQ